MNILLATYWPLPHLGGVWPFMDQIKQRLEQKGHSVDILGNGPDTPKYHLVYTDREISKDHLLPLLKAKLTTETTPLLHKEPWVYQVELDRYCMELAAAYFGLEQYDVIHTQDVISTLALSRVKPKRTGLVANIHGSLAREVLFALQESRADLTESVIWKYYRAIEYYGAMAAHVTIASSQWLKNLLVHDFQIPDSQITVFQYGLDTDKFDRIKARGTDIKRPPNKKVIICPARLVFIKGLHHLIPALAKLKQVRSDWVCWIVGEGDKKGELQDQAKELGVQEDVLFLGHRDDVPALLGLADLFVHPSIQDNQPFSVMEAQTAGLPSVVSDAGGLPEIVQHGVTGLVSPVGDVDRLFSHLLKLVEDDAYRHRLSANALRWGKEHWSMELMLERLMGVYEKSAAMAAAKGGV